MFRVATVTDLAKIVDMGIKFLETTEYKDFYDKDTTEETLYNIILGPKDTSVILITEDELGFLAGKKVPFAFGKGFLAAEVGWWIEPEVRKLGHGRNLLDGFEYWAKNVAGCFGTVMVSLDDQLGSFYEKNGYKLCERAYMKVF